MPNYWLSLWKKLKPIVSEALVKLRSYDEIKIKREINKKLSRISASTTHRFF